MFVDPPCFGQEDIRDDSAVEATCTLPDQAWMEEQETREGRVLINSLSSTLSQIPAKWTSTYSKSDAHYILKKLARVVLLEVRRWHEPLFVRIKQRAQPVQLGVLARNCSVTRSHWQQTEKIDWGKKMPSGQHTIFNLVYWRQILCSHRDTLSDQSNMFGWWY